MQLPITTLYALPLALIFLTLWTRTTMQRARSHVSLGDGNDPELLEWIRRHGNFTEWVPIILVLMALAELQGAGRNWLHIAGILLVFGRLVHPFGLFADRATTFGRIAGNSACFIATALLTAVLLFQLAG